MTSDVRIAPDEAITGSEVARRLGVSRERVRQWAQRDDFPRPFARIGPSIVWRADDIARWAENTGRALIDSGGNGRRPQRLTHSYDVLVYHDFSSVHPLAIGEKLRFGADEVYVVHVDSPVHESKDELLICKHGPRQDWPADWRTR